MAKYTSLVFNEVSGKMGSMILDKNGVARRRVIPKNPNTAAQQAVRNGFAAGSAAWKALTPAQWAGWAALASQITLTNAVGKKYSPTGRRLFISCFQNCRTAGQDAPTAPPAYVPSVAGVTNFAVTVTPPATGHPNGQMTVTGGFSIAGCMIIIRATKPYSPDRNYVGASDFRVLAVSSDDDGPPSPDDLAALYAARFGIPAAGAKISFETFQVDVPGFAGPLSRADVSVGVSAEAAKSPESDMPGLKVKKAA